MTTLNILSQLINLNRCVIPSGGGPTKKAPLVEWTEYQKRLPTEAEIHDWLNDGLNPTLWGIVTGAVSGIVVFDADDAATMAIFHEAGLKPHVKTRRGEHYYFRHPGHLLNNKVGIIPHLDLRGDGGFVNCLGSNDSAGYEMLILPTDGSLYDLQQLPLQVKQALLKPAEGIKNTDIPPGEQVPDGQQNRWLYGRACGYRAKGDTEEQILQKLRIDLARCPQTQSRPFTEDNLRKIVESACKHQPGTGGVDSTTVFEYEDETEDTPKPTDTGLMVPEISWRPGVFANYRALMSPTTEASDNYHFVGIMHILSMTLNRNVSVFHIRRNYPNIYSVLIGVTGGSRKDTANNKARDIIMRLHENSENERFAIISGVGSAEGLIDELEGQDKIRLLNQPEFASLITKSRQKGLANLIPVLTELWDNPDCYSPRTRTSGKVTCERPFLSIMAGSAPEWLLKNLNENDIYGGFGNRWIYVIGKPTEAKPNPPKMNEAKLNTLVKNLNEIRKWALELPDNGELKVDEDANNIFEIWYHEHYEKEISSPDGIIPKLCVRIQDYIWKIGLMYACADQSAMIMGEHMEAAVYVSQFLEASICEVFRNFTISPNKQYEDRIIQIARAYKATTRKPIPERELYRTMHISAEDLTKFVKPLVTIGILRKVTGMSRRGEVTTYDVF